MNSFSIRSIFCLIYVGIEMLGTIGSFVQDKNQYEKVTIVTHRDTYINTSFLVSNLMEKGVNTRFIDAQVFKNGVVHELKKCLKST